MGAHVILLVFSCCCPNVYAQGLSIITFKIKKFDTSSHPNLEVKLTKFEKNEQISFVFKSFCGQLIEFGLHKRHLVSYKSI